MMLHETWQEAQEGIFDELLESSPDLSDMAAKFTGLRLAVGLTSNRNPSRWAFLPAIGAMERTPAILDLPESNINLNDRSADCILCFSDGAQHEVLAKEAVKQAQRRLVTVAIRSLRDIIRLSAEQLKSEVHHEGHQIILHQELLAISCQAEMIDIATNDSYTYTGSLLAAIADLCGWYLRWGTQVEQLEDTLVMLAQLIGRQIGSPWLLNHGSDGKCDDEN